MPEYVRREFFGGTTWSTVPLDGSIPPRKKDVVTIKEVEYCKHNVPTHDTSQLDREYLVSVRASVYGFIGEGVFEEAIVVEAESAREAVRIVKEETDERLASLFLEDDFSVSITDVREA
jgi:hypothetical protein